MNFEADGTDSAKINNFSPFFSLSEEMLVVMDFQGTIQQLNPQWSRFLGGNINLLLGNNILEFIHLEDINIVQKILQNCYEHQEVTQTFTVRFRTNQGYQNLDWKLYSLAEQELIYGVAKVNNNAGTPAFLREEVDFNEEVSTLKLALKSAGVGIWDWQIVDNNMTWSEGCKRIFGASINQLPANYEAFLNFVHPEERSRVMSALIQAIETKKDYELEHKIIRVDGSIIWVNCTGKLLSDTVGNAQRMTGTIRDITIRKNAVESLQKANEELEVRVESRTAAIRRAISQLHNEISERKEIEEQLRKSQEMLQLVMDYIPQLIAWKDRNFVYLGCNKALANMAGLSSPEEIVGKTDHELAWKRNRADYFRECDLNVMRTNTPELHVIETQFKPNGERVWLDKNRIPLHDGEGNVVGILVTSEDITERKEAEDILRSKTSQLEATIAALKSTQAQLIQTEKMSSLGQLVAGLAHEINNPVNFIYGNINYANQYINELISLLKLYQDNYPEPCEAIRVAEDETDLEFLMTDLPKVLNSMQVGAERIREIVLSLRSFSRLDESEKKKVNIHTGLESTLLIIQHRLKPNNSDPGIQLIKNYQDLPEVECYPSALNQVFMNLLTNAIDAVEARSHPRIIKVNTEVNLAKNTVLIKIKDNGLGFDEEIKKRLFDPFFTTKEVGKGTGLGLSICYQIIVQKHQGSLTCNSQLGIGTKFVVEIPISQF